MYGNPNFKYGERNETVLSIKLRIQEEMGIPVKCITVYWRKYDEVHHRSEYISENSEGINSGAYIEIT